MENHSNMNVDVFVSYAAKDRERVLHLVDHLRQSGIGVWIDQSGIDVATLWSEEIVNAITNCKVLLLAISQNSTESANVVKELALASERGKHIIPIFLEPAKIPGTMEYQLAGIQRVEFYLENEEAALKAIRRSLLKFGVTAAEPNVGTLDGPPQTKSQPNYKPQGRLKNAKLALLLIASMLTAIVVIFISTKPSSQPELASGESADTLERQSTPEILTTTSETTIPLSQNKLAILPFKVLSRERDEFLSEGMTMELISKLQPLKKLTVIASNSTMKFADSELTAKEIGKQLKAGSILKGTIQNANEELKVIVNLVNANTDEVEWSKAFTGSTKNILYLQSEIARSVANELEIVLTEEEIARVTKKPTKIPEAYEHYIEGRIEWKKRSKKSLAKAVNHFEKAIKIDPTFALAYSGLADIYAVYPFWEIESPLTALPKAKTNAEKAISLDPLLAEAWNNLAFVESHYFNWKKAEENFQTAIKLNGNYSTAWHWRGAVLMRMGQNDDERSQCANKAYELDPKYAELSSGMAHLHMDNEDYEEALWYMQNAYNLSNNENKIYKTITAEIYYKMNEPSKGIKVINETFGEDLSSHPQALVALALCYSKKGDKGKCYELLSNLLHILVTKERYIPEDKIADIYAELGDKSKTLFWIKRGIENFSSNATMFVSKPVYRKWVNDPEFVDLQNKVGLKRK